MTSDEKAQMYVQKAEELLERNVAGLVPLANTYASLAIYYRDLAEWESPE